MTKWYVSLFVITVDISVYIEVENSKVKDLMKTYRHLLPLNNIMKKFSFL